MSDSPNDPTNPEDPTVGGPNGPSGTGPEPTGAEQDAGSDPVLPGAPVGHLGPDGTTEVTATEAGDRTVTLVDPLDESEVDRISQIDLNQEMQRSRSEEHTSELQSRGHLVCRLLLEKKKPRRAGPRRLRAAPHRS